MRERLEHAEVALEARPNKAIREIAGLKNRSGDIQAH